MMHIFSKFRIPTLLGLGLILTGIISGVFLVLKDQPFNLISEASPDVSIPKPNLSNVTDYSTTISFKTNIEIQSFLTYGLNSSGEQTLLDDKDEKKPVAHKMHYFTIGNLDEETTYKYRVTAGKNVYEGSFKTAKRETSQNGYNPVIGSVSADNNSITEGIVYLSVAGASTQSALIKNSHFLIPISFMRKADLSDTFVPDNLTKAKLSIVSDLGEANILFILNSLDNSLPPVDIGEELDLTEINPLPTPVLSDFERFDLNGDGQINAADNAMILKNFGPLRSGASKNPRDQGMDFNNDGFVDQKDLDLMIQQIKK